MKQTQIYHSENIAEGTKDEDLKTDSFGKKGLVLYERNCAVCNEPFETVYKSKQLCSWDCKQKRQRQNGRINMRRKRMKQLMTVQCEAYGCLMPITETHHEGYDKTYQLCPSHHASITRGYASLQQVLSGWPKNVEK